MTDAADRLPGVERPVLAHLLASRALTCPFCGSPLASTPGGIGCVPCRRDFGSGSGPLTMLDVHSDVGSEASLELVESIRTGLQLPETAAMRDLVREAIAATGAKLDGAHLEAESRLLAERMGLPPPDAGASEPAPKPVAARRWPWTRRPTLARDARLEFVRHFIGPNLTAGAKVLRSIRVRNCGTETLQAEAVDAKVRASFEGAGGSLELTALPVDIAPGQELTVIAAIRAPDAPGPATLRIALGSPEAERQNVTEWALQVIPCETPLFDFEYHAALPGYGDDHHVAFVEGTQFIAGRFGERKLDIVEIGGGAHPTCHAFAAAGHRCVNADISHAQSLLGTAWFDLHRTDVAPNLAFVTCDGLHLPCAAASVDAVMFFSAFHHFSDPVALLAEARRILRPGGFAYIACDRCVPDSTDETYRLELRRGINEQMWTLAEYAEIFRQAGLRVERARIDFFSLKVFVSA